MKTKFLTILTLFCTLWISASNLVVTNVELKNYNETEGWVQIECDISWSGSWRIDTGPSNWDAVWVFAKYRADGGPWRHVTLTSDHTTVVSGHTVDVSNDNRGAFIYRDAVGNGGISPYGTLLGWDLNANGLNSSNTIEVKVFAIEMVYVPEGAFYVGSTGTETGAFRKGTSTITGNEPYLIDSEGEITIGTTVNDLYYDATSYGGDQLGPIPAEFPKGYDAFYCMKYEISEAQYVAFFNTVDTQYQDLVDITKSSFKNSDAEVDGNTVAWAGTGNEATTTVPDRACGFISSGVLYRYLQWAALRPMTEFEYEKASRGPGYPVAEAFAWGNTNIITAAYGFAGAFLNTETEYSTSFTTTGEGRASYDVSSANYPRPTRCGSFSYNYGTAVDPKAAAGGSYYGIMELSGNLIEQVIGIGSASGRSYQGTYGSTTVTGYAVAYDLSRHQRGGGWNSDVDLLRTADRTYAGTATPIDSRIKEMGGRGVRGAAD